jgi:galactonate dehydratase
MAHLISLQAAAAPASDRDHEITEMQAFPIREPVSGRSYTVLRLRTRSGLTGYGESARITAADLEKARVALKGKPATAYAVLSTGTALDGGINMALLDITAKACSTPVYRLLGGPTRFKVRTLAALQGATDAELQSSLATGLKAGFKAFLLPVPPVTARNQGQAFDRAVRARLKAVRSAGEGIDFVLGGSSSLTAGDAASVAASIERFHPLWFDEPCPVSNIRTIQKISSESVTPLGFGRDIREPSLFQDLLREGVVDILRPDIHRSGISGIRQIAAVAETYYVAVAPNHDGGPIATAAALHLAASLPNFFIQHLPLPAAEQDRRVRAEIVSPAIEAVRDGFLSLPRGSGLGIEVNEKALENYKDKAL